MYLKTSEAFAKKYAVLAPIVELIDSQIVKTADPELVPETIAGFIGKSKDQVEAVLRHYAKAGTLEAVGIVRCRDEGCDASNEIDEGRPPAYCTVCGGSSFKSEQEAIYRLAAPGVDERSRVLAGLPTGEWPDNVVAYRGLVDAVIVSIKSEEFEAVAKRFDLGTTVSGRREWNMCRAWSDKADRSFLIALVRTVSPLQVGC
jgi:hypothetical protein